MVPTTLESLPDAILQEILKLLPVPEMFRHRTVCKKWSSLLSSSSFFRAQEPWVVRKEMATKVFSLSMLLDRVHCLFYTSSDPMFSIPLPILNHDMMFSRVIDTHVGLLCLEQMSISRISGQRKVALYIVNPLNGSCRRLPNLPRSTCWFLEHVQLIVQPPSNSEARNGNSTSYKVYAYGRERSGSMHKEVSMITVYDSILGSWVLTTVFPSWSSAHSVASGLGDRTLLAVRSDESLLVFQLDHSEKAIGSPPSLLIYRMDQGKFVCASSDRLPLPKPAWLTKRNTKVISERGMRAVDGAWDIRRVFEINERIFFCGATKILHSRWTQIGMLIGIWELIPSTLRGSMSWRKWPGIFEFLKAEELQIAYEWRILQMVCFRYNDLLVMLRMEAVPPKRGVTFIAFDTSINEWCVRTNLGWIFENIGAGVFLFEPRIDTIVPSL